ncbi:MAG: HD domain-containing protein [Thermoproteota archaeon]|nr:HD domain-containing protein [Thermoproteota archaeon]
MKDKLQEMFNNTDNKNNNKNYYIKTGFTKLLKPFEESINDIEKITKSFGLAIKIHSDIVRKYQSDDVEPQINHSLRVALILSEEINMNESDLVCSALLHDVYNKEELSQETKEYIKIEIGEKIYKTISFFSKKTKKNDDKSSSSIEKQISKIKQADTYVKCIFLAERLDDTRSLKNSRRKDKISRFKEETQKYFLPLAEQTNEKILLKLIIALYELK